MTLPENRNLEPDADARLQELGRMKREQFWGRFWSESGIFGRYRQAVAKKLDPRGGALDHAIASAVAFSERERPTGSIYFHGPVGCGKTLLASKMLYYRAWLHDKKVTESGDWPFEEPAFDYGRIVSVPALLARIRDTFSPESERTRDVINEFRFGRFVVLDDIGAESPTDWVRDIMFQIIDWRYGYNAPTVFTSNCTLRQLADRLGERIADRILEMSGDRVIEIKCGSYRFAPN